MIKITLSTILFFCLTILGAQNGHIAIRQINGHSEFYFTGTNEPFQPRGFNYIQLVQSPNGFFGESQLFQPDSHDPIAIDDDFQRMSALGYNAVRVFVDLCRGTRCIADDKGLVAGYIQNISNLLKQAKTYGIYVMLTANWLPDAGGYSGPAHDICHSSGDFEGGNCLIMSSKGVELYQQFFADFINALKSSGAPMDAIWAYELRNEFFLEDNYPPFNKSSGIITTANGKSYDMSSAAAKDEMRNDALVYWANSVRATIRDVDANALVCCGFFTPNDPNPLRENDPRIVPFQSALDRSDLDFFDVHAYAGFHEFQLEVENYHILDYKDKPVVLGEYGTFLPNASNEFLAAQLSDHWQSDACNYGIGGFLYWTWDRHRTNSSNPDDPWAGSDEGAFIGKVLSPKTKVDPCEDLLLSTNVALGMPAKASMEWEEFVAENVVDGNATQTPWIAGSDPPQWVEVDLGAVYELEAIQIVVETGSDDPHFYTHEIQVRRLSTESYRTVHKFAADRVNFEVLTFKPDDNRDLVGVRYVRVLIPQAPGWAALHELRALTPERRMMLDVPAPPILTSPRPSLDQNHISVIGWKNDTPGLESAIQIASDSLLNSIIEEASGLTQEEYDVSHLATNTILWFKVKQKNSIGESFWSVTGKIEQMSTGGREYNDLFRIYPNPVEERLYIEDNDFDTQILSLQIHDINGERVYWQKEINQENNFLVSHLPPGIYLLQLKTASITSYHRFVKI